MRHNSTPAGTALRCCAWLALLALVVVLPACQRRADRIPQQAYVWQRVWTPALAAAIETHRERLSGWRVLAAERSRDGRFVALAPDFAALIRSRRPLVAVLRWDGRIELDDRVGLRREIATLIDQWQRVGAALTGIEIDHDCASARLANYRETLLELRAELPVGMRLSITALPAWLGQDELPALLRAVDEAVLQLHAVDGKAAQLFDSEQAWRWTQAFAAQHGTAFRIALPTYGSRVWRGADSAIRAVESEPDSENDSRNGEELRADPTGIADFLRRLERDHAENLIGIVWFRLPTADDRRAWSPATFAAVVDGRALRAALAASAEPSPDGAYDLLLVNRGTLDAPLPRGLRVSGRCSVADASAGFVVEQRAADWIWRVQDNFVLRADYRRKLGWIRCDEPPQVQIDVDPE